MLSDTIQYNTRMWPVCLQDTHLVFAGKKVLLTHCTHCLILLIFMLFICSCWVLLHIDGPPRPGCRLNGPTRWRKQRPHSESGGCLHQSTFIESPLSNCWQLHYVPRGFDTIWKRCEMAARPPFAPSNNLTIKLWHANFLFIWQHFLRQASQSNGSER